ncbi:hypothetical protein OXPF_01790 [Oxobacter pfennigii]|uniref:Glyoxalase-like domain protein n=1 Tax=Oxobacter pfennigii TaxID=36849 RepID=A0A0P8YGS6_9CLOT|nr:hypothetical protein [Oxobacter pfennigii]KPU46260.1 hypothetical protein OXPF_01790 [Oxobacter pfennigii]
MDKSNIKIKLRTIVLDCEDAKELSDFYSKLLGWGRLGIDERSCMRNRINGI